MTRHSERHDSNTVIKEALDKSFLEFCRKALTSLDRRFGLFLDHLADRLRQRWLRPKQAGSYLGISESTLEKMRKAGKGPRYRKFGRFIVYSVEDLDAFMKRFPAQGDLVAPGL